MKKETKAYKGSGVERKVEPLRQVEKNDRKGRKVFDGIFNDFVSEIYSEKGAYMWNTKRLPWKIHPSQLITYRAPLIIPHEEVSDNIIKVNVAAVPTFPSREIDSIEYLKIVFVHVADLAKDKIDEIIKIAARVKTKIITYSQTEIRDTCIVVIADNQERGANVIMQHKARMKGSSGTRIAYTFGTKQGARIRKLLYTFFSVYLGKRAEAVESKGTTSLQKKGITTGIFGALKDCCEFVAGLSIALRQLASRIKIPWGARKTKEERQRDKMSIYLSQPEARAEEEVKVREEMRNLSKAEMLKKDRGKAMMTGVSL